MIKSLRVILWGEEVGRLAWDERRRLSYLHTIPISLRRDWTFLRLWLR